MDAAACIVKGDIVKARDLVALAEEIAPTDIHTHCNKGKLSLLSDDDNAREAAFQMLDLYTEIGSVPRIRFMIDHAYFMAEAGRSEQDLQKSGEIFDECLLEIPSCSEPELTRAHCIFMALKTKVRRLKKVRSYDDSWTNWGQGTLHQVMDYLAELSFFSIEETSASYKAYMWLWLAEIQFLTLPPQGQEQLATELDEFRARTNLERTSEEDCLKRAKEIALDNEGITDCKITTRIAKLCLEKAFRVFFDGTTATSEVRLYWLRRSLDDSKWWMETYYDSFMCLSNVAQALRQIWATIVYQDHSGLVRRTFSHINNGQALDRGKSDISEFCIFAC